MKPEVRTSKYKFSHGKAPRGFGGWAFSDGSHDCELFWHYGTYSEAKKAAQNHFNTKTTIQVEP